MIVFPCAHCQKSLKVKEELAGKKVKCPKCAQTTAVPVPEKVASPLPNPGLSWLEMPSEKRPETMLPAKAVKPPGKDDKTVLPAKPARPPGKEGKTLAPPKLEISDRPTNPPADRHTDVPAAKQLTDVKQQQTGHIQAQLAETRLADVNPEFTEFLAPPQQADEIGRLGTYRVLKVLGNGGMGVVFKAEDPHLERLVALKAMLPELAVSVSAKKRFLREARAAAGIKHPHVVTIFQVGEDRGAPFLAMEFLEGYSLDDYLRQFGVLPIDDVLRIGRQIAEGLGAAHDMKLIHRDIKPANIWLERLRERPRSAAAPSPAAEAVFSKDAVPAAPAPPEAAAGALQVKILDFGLARSENDAAHLTQSGAFVGTPAYMAPEQATGAKNIDLRCDLFSLGCVLYRMATGEAPFKGDDTIAILSAIAMEEPTLPALINTEVPDDLSDLIMKLLSKKPDARPNSAHEVAETLQALEDMRTIALAKRQQLSPFFVRLAAVTAGVGFVLAALASFVYRVAAAAARWSAPYVWYVCEPMAPPFRWLGKRLSPWTAPIGKRLAPLATWTSRRGRRLWRLYPGTCTAVILGLCLLLTLPFFFGGRRTVPNPPDNDRAPIAGNDEAAKRLARNPLDGLDPRNIRLVDLAFVGGGDPKEAPTELVGLLGSVGFRFDVDLTGVAYSPDDENIAVCGGGGLVAIYNAESAAKLVTCKGHLGKVNALVYSNDGTRLLTGGDDETAIVWDAQTGEPLTTLKGEKLGPVMSVALSPDGKRVATAHDVSALVKIWDAATGKDLVTFKGHVVDKPGKRASSVVFFPDGKRVLSCARYANVKVWDPDSAAEIPPNVALDLYGDFNYQATVSTDGTRCTCVPLAAEGLPFLWSSKTGKEIFRLGRRGGQPITGAEFNSNGNLLFADNGVDVYDGTVTLQRRFEIPGSTCKCARFSNAGSRVVAAWSDRTVRVFDVTSGKEIRPPNFVTGQARYAIGVARLDFSLDGKLLATAAGAQTEPARIWEVATGDCTFQNLEPVTGSCGSIIFSPDSSRLFLAAFDGGWEVENTVRVWNSTSGKKTFDMSGNRGHSDPNRTPGTHSLAFDGRGTIIASGGRDSLVKIFDPLTGQLIKSLKGHNDEVYGVSLRYDGKRVGSASRDKTIRIWDVDKAQEIHTLKQHQSAVYSVAYNPDGDRLVSASADRTCRIWNADTGKELLIFTAHTGPVRVARFSPDGKRVASCGDENTIRLWDPVTGKQEHFFLKGNVTNFNDVAFSPDGNYLAAAGANGLVYILKLPPLP